MNTITMHVIASLADRLRQYTRRAGVDECWEWRGARDTHGYGILSSPAAAGPIKAHRLAVALDGRDPTEHVVRHTCDNPPCVNPAHLIVGTQLENMADARRRGSYQGERNGQAKLTADEVREIRQCAALGTVSHKAIGEIYGVCQQTVSNIVSGKRWGHVK